MGCDVFLEFDERMFEKIKPDKTFSELAKDSEYYLRTVADNKPRYVFLWKDISEEKELEIRWRILPYDNRCEYLYTFRDITKRTYNSYGGLSHTCDGTRTVIRKDKDGEVI